MKKNKSLKIVIFTNNLRSIEIINQIKRIKFLRISLIVISKKFLSNMLIEKIKKYKINKMFFENNKIKILKKISILKPDFIICAGFPKLISLKILNLPGLCSINLHAGKVPTYLGGSPLNWQIVRGEKSIYLSAIKMNEKIDDGPLICEKKIKIKNTQNIDQVKVLANKHFPALCIRAIENILKKRKLKYFKKNTKKYWKQRNKENSEIFPKKSKAIEVHNLIRACSTKDYPAYTNYKNKKLYLYRSVLPLRRFKKSVIKSDIIFKKKEILLKCSDQFLIIDKFKI